MKHYVILAEGLGNRMYHIFNFLDKLDDIIFVWQKTTFKGNWECEWEDIFDYPKLNIVYTEEMPDKQINKVTNFLETVEGEYWKWNVDFNKKTTQNLVQKFIDSLVPSKQVIEKMIDLPQFSTGHVVRTSHVNSVIGRTPKIIIPKTDFLSTDSAWIREINPHCYQTKAIGGPYDSRHKYKVTSDAHSILRNKQGCLYATADWLMLFRCNKIYEYGTYFNGYEGIQHSSFTAAHRICGKEIINETSKYDIGQFHWKPTTDLEILKVKAEILSNN